MAKTKKRQKTKTARSKAMSKSKRKVAKVAAAQPPKTTVPEVSREIPKKVVVRQDIEKSAPPGRQELDDLIKKETLKEGAIFSEKPDRPQEAPIRQDLPTPPEPPINTPQPSSIPDYVYEPEEPVSMYRKILLWASVVICAAVIGFGWFLTVGGSLGLQKVGGTEADTYQVEEITNDLKSEVDNLNKEDTQKTTIENKTLQDLVEKIKNSTNTAETIPQKNEDIFNPPESVE